MSQPATITISAQVLAELEPVAAESHESIEAVVNAAIAEYLRALKKRQWREQLAKQYEELAAMWKELAEERRSQRSHSNNYRCSSDG
ncbi:MAG: hypothetical protein HYZ35_05605 [Chloroflexi bacterium]|nr:hypothetical protein [Chloroflexota bacterium]